jgi:hypothetical protein
MNFNCLNRKFLSFFYISPLQAASNLACWSATAHASIIGPSLQAIINGIHEKF